MQIEYSRQFIKCFEKCPKNIKNKFKERLGIFLLNKNSYILHNHQLSGKLNGYRSINVSGDYRAIFQELENDQVIYFVAIGSPTVIIEKLVNGSWTYHGTTYASACGYYTYDTGGTGQFRARIGGYYYMRTYPGCAT